MVNGTGGAALVLAWRPTPYPPDVAEANSWEGKMKTIRPLSFLAAAMALLPAPAAFAGLVVGAPIDVIGNLSLAQFTGLGYGTNTYKDWGNEPFVAVNPTNPNDVLISSFAYNTSTTKSGANVFYSTTGGSSWTSQFSVPAPAAGTTIPNDWNFTYNSAGTLHGTVLGGGNIFQGATADPTSLAAWSYTGGGAPINVAASAKNADQPRLALSGGNVFVAYDDFHSNTAERVAVSSNNGASFTVDNPINNGAQANSVNPGTRIATDGSGAVYSLFGVGGATVSQGVHDVSYYLNRSRDGGVTWDFNGSSGIGGILVASGVSSQLDNAGTQASNNWFAGVNDLRGNITAIASDKTGSHIYVLYGAQDNTGTDRIYLVEFHPVGANLVASTPLVISPAFDRAALPAITVKADGTVVMMYETFGDDGKIHIHVASSIDFGASIDTDIQEYAFTPLTLLQATGSTTTNREFGDYDFLTSLGNVVYGTFAGLGDVNAGGIDTTGLVDPFFFSGTDVPEPGSLWLVLAALGATWFHSARKSGTVRGAVADR
jgi:hypothetical protein